MKIDEWDALDPDRVGAAWQLYERVFTPVNALAAQRHLMTRAEFDTVADDKRVAKFLARADDGALCGISTITDNLEAWPLVSPAFFARHWPDHYAARRIFYVGFVGVATYSPASVHVFSALIGAMQPRVDACAGIAVMDFCAFNVDARKLPQAAWTVQERLRGGPVLATVVDRQEFWAFDHGLPPMADW